MRWNFAQILFQFQTHQNKKRENIKDDIPSFIFI